jgi:predicted  nucleic acid-binding Zn-ribbon protein
MKIKEEQLNTIKDQQAKINDLINQIGILEANKHGVLHEMAAVNQEINEYKKELEKEYGSININVEDGSYTVIEQESEPAIAAV